MTQLWKEIFYIFIFPYNHHLLQYISANISIFIMLRILSKRYFLKFTKFKKMKQIFKIKITKICYNNNVTSISLT